MTNFPIPIPSLWCCIDPSNTHLHPKKDDFTGRRRDVSSLQHPEVSAGKFKIVMVEEFPPSQTWFFLGFIFLNFFITAHFPLPLQPGNGSQPVLSPRYTKGYHLQAVTGGVGSGEECVSSPHQQNCPRAGTGEASVTGPQCRG